MRFSNTLLCLALVSVPSVAASEHSLTGRGEGWSAELEAAHRALESNEPSTRRRALTVLHQLDAQALPALIAHLSAPGHQDGFEPAELAEKLALLREAGVSGSRAEGDGAALLAHALASDRSPAMRAAVELRALLSALEAQRSPAAGEVLFGSLVALSPRALRVEALQARRRLTWLMVPTFLRHRRDPDPVLSRLARDGLAALGVTTTERSFDHTDGALLAAVIEAHAEVGTREALPHIVAYLHDERPEVRHAAYEATTRFGPRALPWLQQQIAARTGAEPDPEASTEQLLSALRREQDAHTERWARPLLERATRDFDAGKLDDAEHHVDAAAARGVPAELADGIALLYASLAARHETEQRTGRALRLYRRAARSDPDGGAGRSAAARASYLEAEYRLRTGVADLAPLTESLTLDPTLEPARDLLSELDGSRDAAEDAERRRLGLLSAALLALSGLLLFFASPSRTLARGAPTEPAPPHPAPPPLLRRTSPRTGPPALPRTTRTTQRTARAVAEGTPRQSLRR